MEGTDGIVHYSATDATKTPDGWCEIVALCHQSTRIGFNRAAGGGCILQRGLEEYSIRKGELSQVQACDADVKAKAALAGGGRRIGQPCTSLLNVLHLP
jgi:hypothetical protein